MMKRSFLSCLLVFAVAVMLLYSMAAPAFAAETPVMAIPRSGDFYRDSLPFGWDTVVVDIGYNYNNHLCFRYLLPPESRYDIEFNSDHTICYLFVLLPDWTNLMYRQQYYTDTGNFNNPHYELIEWDSTINGRMFSQDIPITNYNVNTFWYHANIYSIIPSLNSPYKPVLYRYPTRDLRNVTTVVNAINSAASSIAAADNSRYRAEMTQASQNHAQDMTQRSQQHSEDMSQRDAQHSEIMNAGSNEPTLDVDTNWMDDSLSKVNGWLDDLSNFDAQMSNNRAENAENMSRAQQFLSTFFGSVPSAIIAAMALCLVVVVVVKIVGR